MKNGAGKATNLNGFNTLMLGKRNLQKKNPPIPNDVGSQSKPDGTT